MDDNEELGIIQGVNFGKRDTNAAILWFSVHTLHGAALQCLSASQAAAMIAANDIYKISDLEGAPCVVRRTHIVGTIEFLRLFHIP